VAYNLDGRPTHPVAAPPNPCMVSTGFATVETHIALTRDAIVYEPAMITPGIAGSGFPPYGIGPRPQQPTSPAGLAVSSNEGRTWEFVKPAGALWTNTDAALYTDRSTGRIFEETLSPGQIPAGGDLAPQEGTPGGYAYLLTSGNDGKTWSHTALAGFLYQENARFTSAPAPFGQVTPAGGYPDITYWCGNRLAGLMAPLIFERECWRSIDAGVTWDLRSLLLTNPVPQHPECGVNREDISSGDGNYPQGAADGSLYVMVSCGGNVYLARSTDELATTPIIQAAGGPLKLPIAAGSETFGWPELRVTRVGGTALFVLVYATSPGSRPALQMRTSRDGGRTWTSPVQLTPSGLPSIDRWAVAVRDSEVAVSYVSQSVTIPGGYDGYIGVTRNVLEQGPAIWTATINDPRQPMLTSAPQSAKDDYIGVDIGPDLTPWASFFSPCGAESKSAAATDPACEQAQGISVAGTPIGNERGIVGRVLFP
jgi:hypothetical protein